MQIRTARLNLRTCQIRDAAAYHRINTNPINIANEPHSNPDQPISWYESNIAKDRGDAAAGKNNFMSVCLPSPSEMIEGDEVVNEEVIGMCGFNSLRMRDSEETAANIGVMIDEPWTRRGYGLEVFRVLLDYSFTPCSRWMLLSLRLWQGIVSSWV